MNPSLLASLSFSLLPCFLIVPPPSPGAAEGGPAVLEAAESSPAAPESIVFRFGDGGALRLAGSVQADARVFSSDSAAPSSFDLRRARLEILGTVATGVAVRLQAALEDNPYVRNAWIELGRSDRLRLRVGQMKVPFSTEWLTQDNHLIFLERAASTPVYPYLDRGAMAWGRTRAGAATWAVGAFNGAGIDADAPRSDVDDHKDLAARLFLLPFVSRPGSPLAGLHLAVGGTRALTEAPSRRFETRGLTAATYESLLWRWRTEQVIGANGRATDEITAETDSRTRLGAEALYNRGPVSGALEWARVDYRGIRVYHDYRTGSRVDLHEAVLAAEGKVTLVTAWIAVNLTGESRRLDAFGWTQPQPSRPWGHWTGPGAWELHARYSTTRTDPELFESVRVSGYGAGRLGDLPPVGAGGFATAAVVEGAPVVDEITLGVAWTVDRHLRLQLDVTRLSADATRSGRGILSGGAANAVDEQPRLVDHETMAGLRLTARF